MRRAGATHVRPASPRACLCTHVRDTRARERVRGRSCAPRAAHVWRPHQARAPHVRTHAGTTRAGTTRATRRRTRVANARARPARAVCACAAPACAARRQVGFDRLALIFTRAARAGPTHAHTARAETARAARVALAARALAARARSARVGCARVAGPPHARTKVQPGLEPGTSGSQVHHLSR
jgi:hypothetical protein